MSTAKALRQVRTLLPQFSEARVERALSEVDGEPLRAIEVLLSQPSDSTAEPSQREILDVPGTSFNHVKGMHVNGVHGEAQKADAGAHHAHQASSPISSQLLEISVQAALDMGDFGPRIALNSPTELLSLLQQGDRLVVEEVDEDSAVVFFRWYDEAGDLQGSGQMPAESCQSPAAVHESNHDEEYGHYDRDPVPSGQQRASRNGEQFASGAPVAGRSRILRPATSTSQSSSSKDEQPEPLSRSARRLLAEEDRTAGDRSARLSLAEEWQRPEQPATSFHKQQSFTSVVSALFLETHGMVDEADSLGGRSWLDRLTRESSRQSEREHELEPVPAIVPSRAYYLDWLRIVAIYSVVFYHCIQGLDWINLWTGTEKKHVMAYKSSSLQIGMPIFFHISGRAQAFSKPKEVITVMLERFVRLIIPFAFGMFVLVPFWQYCQLRDLPGDHPKMYFLWYVWFFKPGHYQFHVGWLWFLPTLFVIGVFSAPVFAFAEKRMTKHAIIFVLLWSVSSGLLICAGCPWQMLLVAMLGPTGLGMLSWLIPFPPRIKEPTWCIKRWLAIQGGTIVVFLSQIGVICSFRYKDLTDLMKMVPACIFFFGFYIHGYFIQRWAVGSVDIVDMTLVDEAVENSEMFTARTEQAQTIQLFTAMWQLFVFWAMLVSIFFGMPVGEWEAELFPIYSAGYRDTPFFGIAHVCGTWAIMNLVITWFQHYADKQVHPEIYKQATSSVMVVYMFHWVFIAPCCYWLCKDFGMLLGWWKLINPFIVMGAGCGGPYFIHLLLMQYPKIKRLVAI